MCAAHLWITPNPAVALNFAQLVARDSQSRFSRRKVSTVVPECMMALAKMMAEWHTLLRTSTAFCIQIAHVRQAQIEVACRHGATQQLADNDARMRLA